MSNRKPLPPEQVPMAQADIDESDVEAVAQVIRSGRLSLGPKVVEFEAAVARYVGVRHAVAMSSGTAALHVIVKALGLGPGDEVLVPSFTFAASVNAILFEGATPVFVDIDPVHYNIDPADCERKISPRTRAILAVDVFGHPAPWERLEKLAKRHGLALIDDCCEAIGAECRGRKLGSFGRAGAFAFYPNKQMTTGEGGILVTDDAGIATAARSLRNQGRAEMGQWLEHARLGYNYRLDEMSAALGVSQLSRLETFLTARERVAGLYNSRLSAVSGVRTPTVDPAVRMSWFVYVIRLEGGLSASEVIRGLEAEGIPARAYFSPIHKQSYIKERTEISPGPLPVTELLEDRTLALPFFNRMSGEQVEIVASALERVIARMVKRDRGRRAA